jgi:hypothetical protein
MSAGSIIEIETATATTLLVTGVTLKRRVAAFLQHQLTQAIQPYYLLLSDEMIKPFPTPATTSQYSPPPEGPAWQRRLGALSAFLTWLACRQNHRPHVLAQG